MKNTSCLGAGGPLGKLKSTIIYDPLNFISSNMADTQIAMHQR